MRTAAIRTLVPHFEHRLFLTATPHNGYKESFSALFRELIDNQRFARGVEPDEAQKAAYHGAPPQDRSCRAGGMARPVSSSASWDAIEVAYTVEEQQVHRWLQEYTHLRRQRYSVPTPPSLFDTATAVDRSDRPNNTEKFATEFVLQLLKEAPLFVAAVAPLR